MNECAELTTAGFAAGRLEDKLVNPFRVRTWHQGNQACRGTIDEVKLYNRALSPEQIKAAVTKSK